MKSRIQQASAKLLNVFVKALLFFVPMVHRIKYLKYETKHVSGFSCNFAPKNKQLTIFLSS